MSLVQSGIHAYNLAQNEIVTASHAWNFFLIARDCYAILAKDNTIDPLSIPALILFLRTRGCIAAARLNKDGRRKLTKRISGEEANF